MGAVQNGGESLVISGKLHWIPKPAMQRWLKYGAYLVSWVTFVALTFYLLTRVRLKLKLLIEVLQINRWARSAIHNFSFVILGLIGLSVIIISENYLRTAVPRNLLLRRIAITLGSALILLGASSALQAFLIHLLQT